MSDLATAQALLKKYWGFDAFRSGQKEVVEAVLSGRDCLALFPTGGGKSLCYQLPALCMEGLTIVISPLIALMQDQVYQLSERGIRATFINSSLSSREVEQRFINARNGLYRIVFLAPERLSSPIFQQELAHLNVGFVAVDEAHCISEWGHEFRPQYRDIRTAFSEEKHSIRWLALTATATPKVEQDILDNLGFEQPEVVRMPFDRPNLNWWVNQTPKKWSTILTSVKRAKGSGLVYAPTRRHCEKLAAQIRESGFTAAPYHAGLDGALRSSVQKKWIQGQIRVVVCTNAFGMGVDKPDCRWVIHYSPPSSLEAYYQEAGRAGRDGNAAHPVLLASEGDKRSLLRQLREQYPSIDQIRHFYNCLCDEWGLAEGELMPDFRSLDVLRLGKRSGFTKRGVRVGLRILGKFGVVELADRPDYQLGLRINLPPEAVREYLARLANRRKAEFAETIFRTLNRDTDEDWRWLPADLFTAKLNITRNVLINGLGVLERDGLLSLRLGGEMAEGRLVHERLRRPILDLQQYAFLKQRADARLEAVMGYIETSGCRSHYLRHYFGDISAPERCNHCDNCLKIGRQASRSIDSKHFSLVLNAIKSGRVELSELQAAVEMDAPSLRQTLRLLSQEGLIQWGTDDVIFLR